MSNEKNVTTVVGIVSILRQFIEKQELLNAAFNQGREGFTTLLLDVDPERGIAVIDAPNDPVLIRKLVDAGNVYYSGTLRGSKIRFVSANTREIRHQNYPALSIRIPATLTTTQNRNSFRIKVAGKYCTLPIPGRGNTRVTISDISVDGVFLQAGSAGDDLHPKQVLTGCSIDLGPFGTISCNLEIRRLKRTPGRGIGVGCRFISLPMRTQSLIAQFVTQEERKRIAV